MYWHYKEGQAENEGGAPLDFTINGTGGIYYSSKALMRLQDILPTIDKAIDAAVINERVTAGEVEDTATICHNGNTKTIPQSAVPAHLGHGDSMGACN